VAVLGRTRPIGGSLLTLGGVAFGSLVTASARSDKTASYWHQSWFLTLIALSALCALSGLYVVLAGEIRWLPPASWSLASTAYESLRPLRRRFDDLVYERNRIRSGVIGSYDHRDFVNRVNEAKYEALETIRAHCPEYEEDFAVVYEYEEYPMDAVGVARDTISAILKQLRPRA
jgi:hypothetical protein